jgi:hypothetical protein
VAVWCDVTFHAVQGKAVCRIGVKPSPKPAYAGGHLIIRTGNQKRRLTAQEALAYCEAALGVPNIKCAIGQHLTNPEIAQRLSLSPKTVRNHVSNILHKLQVADRAQAIVMARDAGLS